jgi:hypothetical protein
MLGGQKESDAREETTIKDFGDILLKESTNTLLNILLAA